MNIDRRKGAPKFIGAPFLRQNGKIRRGIRLYRGYMLQFDQRTFESWVCNGL